MGRLREVAVLLESVTTLDALSRADLLEAQRALVGALVQVTAAIGRVSYRRRASVGGEPARSTIQAAKRRLS